MLEPMLEKHGIVLVPAKRIEYPHILIDIPSKNIVFIRFKESSYREGIEREIDLQVFVEYLEEALKNLSKNNRKQIYIYTKIFKLTITVSILFKYQKPNIPCILETTKPIDIENIPREIVEAARIWSERKTTKKILQVKEC